jgi:protein SCO1/2
MTMKHSTALPALLCISLMVYACAPALAHDEDARTAVSLEQRLGAQIPLALVFTGEDGRTAALREYFKEVPVILALVYYDCPQLCPLVLEGLARSLRPVSFSAGKQYRVIAVSIDPRETAAVAANKKRAVLGGSRPESAGWHFLTGSQSAIAALTDAVGFRYRANEKSEAGSYIHAAGIMILTPEGKVSHYLYGLDFPPRDLRLALIEASGGRIGSPVDQLLLLCYEYDPRAGKYTVTVLNILRISGIATVAALGAGLALMFRRERRGSPRRSGEVS